ncbi:unnamed protein product, partial [Clonostachys chloroleuca]
MLSSLAARHGIKLPSDDLAFTSPGSLLPLTASDFEVLTYEHLKKAYAQTVCLTDVFFDPQVPITQGASYQTGMNTTRERTARDFPQEAFDLSMASWENLHGIPLREAGAPTTGRWVS